MRPRDSVIFLVSAILSIRFQLELVFQLLSVEKRYSAALALGTQDKETYE